MIIKSMARQSPSFSQLLKYFHSTAYLREAPVFTHNLWETGTHEAAAKEMEHNATFLPKSARGKNYLYHEVISLGNHPEVDADLKQRALLDLVQEYVSLRCPDQMVYGRAHLDKNCHFHLCISSNTVRGKQRQSLSKSRFAEIQAILENLKIERYPQLGNQKLYDRDTRLKNREKKDQLQLSNAEIELKKRTKAPSQKEIRRTEILSIFHKARSETDLVAQLKQVDLVLYTRGNQQGVECRRTQRRYRLSTLGLAAEYLTAQKRQALYQSRLRDITKIQSRSPNRERS